MEVVPEFEFWDTSFLLAFDSFEDLVDTARTALISSCKSQRCELPRNQDGAFKRWTLCVARSFLVTCIGARRICTSVLIGHIEVLYSISVSRAAMHRRKVFLIVLWKGVVKKQPFNGALIDAWNDEMWVMQSIYFVLMFNALFSFCTTLFVYVTVDTRCHVHVLKTAYQQQTVTSFSVLASVM